MDLKAWVTLGAMALFCFGYMNYVYLPKQQAWEEKQAEDAAKNSPTPGASPSASPVGSATTAQQ